MTTIPFASPFGRSFSPLASAYGSTGPSKPAAAAPSNISPTVKVDSVDLSPAVPVAQPVSDKVAQIRAAIASGEYERDLDLKLEVAADRILRDLNR